MQTVENSVQLVQLKLMKQLEQKSLQLAARQPQTTLLDSSQERHRKEQESLRRVARVKAEESARRERLSRINKQLKQKDEMRKQQFYKSLAQEAQNHKKMIREKIDMKLEQAELRRTQMRQIKQISDQQVRQIIKRIKVERQNQQQALFQNIKKNQEDRSKQLDALKIKHAISFELIRNHQNNYLKSKLSAPRPRPIFSQYKPRPGSLHFSNLLHNSKIQAEQAVKANQQLIKKNRINKQVYAKYVRAHHYPKTVRVVTQKSQHQSAQPLSPRDIRKIGNQYLQQVVLKPKRKAKTEASEPSREYHQNYLKHLPRQQIQQRVRRKLVKISEMPVSKDQKISLLRQQLSQLEPRLQLKQQQGEQLLSARLQASELLMLSVRAKSLILSISQQQ